MISVGASRSTMPVSPKRRRKPTGSSPSAPSRRSATASAESVPTGPPWKSTCGGMRISSQPGRTSWTGTGEGRLSTTPSAPSSSTSSTSTIVWSKFGSTSIGVATSSRPGARSVPGPGAPAGGVTCGRPSVRRRRCRCARRHGAPTRRRLRGRPRGTRSG